jgi:2-methylcitrate dehydratase PrpD
MTSSLTHALTRLLKRPIDAEARQRSAMHLLDWIGCAIAGSSQPTGKILTARAALAVSGPISVIGASPITSAEEAAFLNGGLGNIFEMDDVHRTAILHPGPVTIPAALAAAEASNATGAELLEGIVRGYEAVIRLGSSVGPGHYAEWHNTATCGPFGSAAAVSSILNIGDEATVWALGNAGTQASGPWRCRHEDVMTKQLHTARAAQAGYAAASLAASGFTGPEYILEGEQGFYSAMCPDAQPENLLLNPEGAWKVWETSFKPWPACRHAHPAIDAALLLRDEELPPPQAIKAIEIKTYGDAKVFCDRPTPVSTIDAKFSLQHSVALSLLLGPPELSGFSLQAISRADISSLRNKMKVTVSPGLDKAYPRHFGCEVRLSFVTGEIRAARVLDALGDPENPLRNDQIIAKSRMLMDTARVAPDQKEQVIQACLQLPYGGSLRDLTAAIQSIDTYLSGDQH